MTKIYMVTSGSYSDYGVRGLFRFKHAAEQYMEIWNKKNQYDTAEIEEVELVEGEYVGRQKITLVTCIDKDGLAGDTTVHLGVIDAIERPENRTYVSDGIGMMAEGKTVRTEGKTVRTEWDYAEDRKARHSHQDAIFKTRAELMGL